MLLAVDAGNTTLRWAFSMATTARHLAAATDINQMADERATLLTPAAARLKTSDIREAAMCSVVPPLVGTFEDLFRRYFKVSPLWSGRCQDRRRSPTPIREIGADRIVNAAAAIISSAP
jgi:type III pantothenate kinase